MNKSLRPQPISFWYYLLQLGGDVMLLLFPVIGFIRLVDGNLTEFEQSWWPIGLGILVLLISSYRIVSTLIGSVAALSGRRWWWVGGAIIRLAVLGFTLYVSGFFLLFLLGAGVSVGEPMG